MKRKSESIVNFSGEKFVLPAGLGNPSQTPFPPLLDELVAEILSWLPVKSLLRFRCVCKCWYSLIFHPSFVKLHLQKSPRNILFTLNEKNEDEDGNLVITGELSSRSLHCCSMRSFLNGFSVPFDFELIVGVCNGLVCASGLSRHDDYDVASVQLWNPATSMRSEELSSLQTGLGLELGLGLLLLI